MTDPLSLAGQISAGMADVEHIIWKKPDKTGPLQLAVLA